jgi:hypothetical protein
MSEGDKLSIGEIQLRTEGALREEGFIVRAHSVFYCSSEAPHNYSSGAHICLGKTRRDGCVAINYNDNNISQCIHADELRDACIRRKLAYKELILNRKTGVRDIKAKGYKLLEIAKRLEGLVE